ncbi:MAG: hypothetical protein MK098_13745 [Marinovum sp.]|nr:hypothetical protein [Marinovum sp.]
MIKPARILGMGACAATASLCGLVFSAARSDFVFRGCPTMPRAEWGTTANCADGWFAQVAFGIGMLALMAAVYGVWRWKPSA